MGLNRYWNEIENEFIVKRNTNGNWEYFRKGVTYGHLQSRLINSKFDKISFMASNANKKDKGNKMILVKNMPDLCNDPFLKKKKEEAIQFL
jgi:hypothetical protein